LSRSGGEAIYLSVVIPAFNEEVRIGSTLDQVLFFLKQQPYSSEIIISNDGSQDQTIAVAKERLSSFESRIIGSDKNKGKGYAVRQGMLEARGRYVLFSDADLSTPIEEITGFLKALQEGYDIVIGSRALPESNIEIHQAPLREIMGKAFNVIARMFSFRDIRDSQCGFKCFKREVARDLFSRQKIDGFSFDAEILYLAQRRGYRILETGVTWRNSPQSRVSILSDPLRMFFEMLKIRRIHR